MTTHSSLLWWIFLLLGLATTLPRSSFIVLGERIALPLTVKRALRYAPAAALAAIIAPDILLVHNHIQLWNPKLIAALCVAIVARISRNPWFPFLIGMGVLVGLQTYIK